MNKNAKLIPYLLSAGLVTSALFFSACSKDDDPSIRPEVEIPTEFSDLTPEENKENLQESGVELVASMETLRNTPGVQTSASFSHFLTVADLPENGRTAKSNQAVKMMTLLAKFGLRQTKGQDLLTGLRSTEEEPGTPQEVFDDLKGTYTYSAANETWVFTAGADAIVFKFPSTKNGTTNNAEFKIYGLTTQQVTNEAAEYNGDVPTGLKADLTVGSQKVIEYNFTASYKSNGEPTAVNTSLTIGAFKLSFEFKNTTSEVSVVYALTQNGNNLLSIGAGASGNFNSDGVGDNTEADDILHSASAFFQIMDIRFAGEVNAQGLIPAIENASTLTAEAAAYNEFVELVVFYADSKELIAETEFYVADKEEEYQSCYWDFELQDYICETVVEEYQAVDVRLVFADDSKADLALYTETGFEALQEELEALVERIENMD